MKYDEYETSVDVTRVSNDLIELFDCTCSTNDQNVDYSGSLQLIHLLRHLCLERGQKVAVSGALIGLIFDQAAVGP